jgi:hypothetical protein
VRVTTAFNKMLGLIGASVATVTFTPRASWSGCAGAEPVTTVRASNGAGRSTTARCAALVREPRQRPAVT